MPVSIRSQMQMPMPGRKREMVIRGMRSLQHTPQRPSSCSLPSIFLVCIRCQSSLAVGKCWVPGDRFFQILVPTDQLLSSFNSSAFVAADGARERLIFFELGGGISKRTAKIAISTLVNDCVINCMSTGTLNRINYACASFDQ